MNRIFSSGKIESACKRDINFMYLLEGAPAPDYATITRFRSLHFSLCSEQILAEVTEYLYSIGEISGEDIFIDGTKIEANANRYTFVWKRAVTRNLLKLLDKAATFVEFCEELYRLNLTWNKKVKVKTLKNLKKKLYAVKLSENIEFVYGREKRRT